MRIDPTTITGLIALVTIASGLLGYGVWRFRKVTKRLETRDDQNKAKNEGRINIMNAQIIKKYETALELSTTSNLEERERAKERFENLRDDIHRLRNELQFVTSRFEEVKKECDELRSLNRQYQSEKQKDGLVIQDLQQTIALLKGEITLMQTQMRRYETIQQQEHQEHQEQILRGKI